MKFKVFITLFSLCFVSACQSVNPIFVDYHGIRRDVAEWINHQQLLNMQQKRSLVQLSRAQQKLVQIDNIPEDQKIGIARENSIAFHCAHLHLTNNKIEQLQDQIFGENKTQILNRYDQQFPKLKIDVNTIQCE